MGNMWKWLHKYSCIPVICYDVPESATIDLMLAALVPFQPSSGTWRCAYIDYNKLIKTKTSISNKDTLVFPRGAIVVAYLSWHVGHIHSRHFVPGRIMNCRAWRNVASTTSLKYLWVIFVILTMQIGEGWGNLDAPIYNIIMNAFINEN